VFKPQYHQKYINIIGAPSSNPSTTTTTTEKQEQNTKHWLSKGQAVNGKEIIIRCWKDGSPH
jgi:hypothetical protein